MGRRADAARERLDKLGIEIEGPSRGEWDVWKKRGERWGERRVKNTVRGTRRQRCLHNQGDFLLATCRVFLLRVKSPLLLRVGAPVSFSHG